MRFVGCGLHRVDPGEIAVRAGGLREDSILRPANTLRQVAAATAISAHRLGTCHRTTVLCTPCRQNTDRDTYQGHAAERRIVHLVLHVAPVNTNHSQLGLGLCICKRIFLATRDAAWYIILVVSVCLSDNFRKP